MLSKEIIVEVKFLEEVRALENCTLVSNNAVLVEVWPLKSRFVKTNYTIKRNYAVYASCLKRLSDNSVLSISFTSKCNFLLA